jgi:ABC-type uncharacterized transport system auxiliary subunit
MKAFALGVAALLSGCALTSKATPIENRYFSPEHAERGRIAQSAHEPLARLRLGRLTSSANLRHRIVRRASAVEVEPYETLRWTESPVEYVQRSLVRAFFETGRFQQVVSGPALTLDVGVIAFEDARRGRRRIGRVQLSYRLHDERVVLTSGLVEVERDAAADTIDSVVTAIGAAMDEAAGEIAARVAQRMREAAPLSLRGR